MKYLIVTGGEIGGDFLADLVKKGGFDVIMAADRGMEVLHDRGIQPDIIVGDFDSVKKEILDDFRRQEQIEICLLNAEKDDTDTEHAIREAIRRGAHQIVLVGANGTRLDHALANIGLLGIGLSESVDICTLDEHNRVRMLDKPFAIKKAEQYGEFVSLLPYGGDVEHVSICGMKYPLTDATLRLYDSLGVSNEIVDEEAQVSFSAGRLLVIEARD